jgi:hypothetical protein
VENAGALRDERTSAFAVLSGSPRLKNVDALLRVSQKQIPHGIQQPTNWTFVKRRIHQADKFPMP